MKQNGNKMRVAVHFIAIKHDNKEERLRSLCRTTMKNPDREHGGSTFY